MLQAETGQQDVSFLEDWASVRGLGKAALEGTLGPCLVFYVMETHSGGLQKSDEGLQCDVRPLQRWGGDRMSFGELLAGRCGLGDTVGILKKSWERPFREVKHRP